MVDSVENKFAKNITSRIHQILLVMFLREHKNNLTGAAIMTTLRQKMKDEMTLFGLAESTQAKYLNILIKLRDYYDKSPAKLMHDEVRQYLLHLKFKKNSQITPTTFKSMP